MLDIIHRPARYLKHDVSETGFCLRLQVVSTQLGPMRRASPVQSLKLCVLHKRQDDL
jgi:hypothetical protein